MSTIGLALVLPEPWRSLLQDYRDRIGDPMGSHIPPHITLLPPIDITPALMALVGAHLEAVTRSTAPISIRLSGTDSFRPTSPVVFIKVSEGVAESTALEKALRSGPLGVDPTWPYHPHVTVAHNLPDEVLDAAAAEFVDFEAEFVADEVTLFVHDNEHDWVADRVFSLRGAS